MAPNVFVAACKNDDMRIYCHFKPVDTFWVKALLYPSPPHYFEYLRSEHQHWWYDGVPSFPQRQKLSSLARP